jgi:virulence-associated protein VapD
MVGLLDTNILQSKELGTYINSYFDCQEIPNTHSTNAVVDGLVYIQKHLHATQIAVWSYLKSIQSSSSSDEAQEKRIEEEIELFHHITSLFHQASAACTHLSNMLYPEKALTHTNDVKDEAKSCSAISAQDAITYDDKGVDDVTPYYQEESNQLHQLRTLVFSGRGQKSNTNNKSGFVDDFESTSNTFSAYTSGRIQLLSELQARLTLMNFGEEINADTSDDLSIKYDHVAQEEKSEGKSLIDSPKQNDFIVPRDLLLELQGKICADSDVHILEYEQDSDDRLEYDLSR